MNAPPTVPVRDVLLTRQGRIFLGEGTPPAGESLARAFELELADLGYVASSRLQTRLSRASTQALAELRGTTLAALAKHVGGGVKHEPLFRKFPDGIPDDTAALFWQRVLVHFVQAEDQPCLGCARTGTTHVLSPCGHVVCDRCFDGASYSACPVCQHKVDRDSPFFAESPERKKPKEQVKFKLLDLGEDVVAETRALFGSLVARTQALSPQDRDALTAVVVEQRAVVLGWLPATIPLRENIALVFGTLFKHCRAEDVLPSARQHLGTATDVLRLIAVMSGADASLQGERVLIPVAKENSPTRFWGEVAALLGKALPAAKPHHVIVPLTVSRFKVAKLPRALRRALLAILDGMPEDRLFEDLLRHQRYWVGVGEFLHPHEYAKRFPRAARGFQVVRKKAPDGTRAPKVHTWAASVETALKAHDVPAMVERLSERPGELARRLDHLLRLAEGAEVPRVLEAFRARVSRLSTPMLATLRFHLPKRLSPQPLRMYWPKGGTVLGISARDARMPLPAAAVQAAVEAVERELLRRFASAPRVKTAIVDEALASVIAPFNERTQTKAAVNLPRGSRIAVPPEKHARLFLHWCERKDDTDSTDLDLSIAFYDAAWTNVGVCSYYHLKLTNAAGEVIAQSGGDTQDAPFPDGGSELVNLDLEKARAAGMRYAVMVVNAYAGQPFGQLERAFAGVMFREDLGGEHFDPRTVELKFALQGEHGVYAPLVLDLEQGVLHWLDVHAKGELELNTVASSNYSIAKMCPELITYFAGGTRASMLDLGLLHGAARAETVVLRGRTSQRFSRHPAEDASAFHARILRQKADGAWDGTVTAPALAVLYKGDLALPEGSEVYALFREQLTPTLAASDLLAVGTPS